MPAPVEITIDRSSRFDANDRLTLEVDGTIDPAAMPIWSSEPRVRIGFGHARFGSGLFGAGPSQGFGRGAFGRGSLCNPSSIVSLAWQTKHIAKDMTIRLRTTDAIGNAGSWSTPFVHAHRPASPTPADAATAQSTINITRSFNHG